MENCCNIDDRKCINVGHHLKNWENLIILLVCIFIFAGNINFFMVNSRFKGFNLGLNYEKRTQNHFRVHTS